MSNSTQGRVVPLGVYPSTMRIGEEEFKGHANVEFVLLDGDGELQVSADAPISAIVKSVFTNIQSEIRLGSSKEWIACLHFGDTDEDTKARFRLMRTPVEVTGYQHKLAFLRFGLVDFRVGRTVPVLRVRSKKWLLELTKNVGDDPEMPLSAPDGSTGFSHVCIVSRVNHPTFDSREVSDLLHMINLFASFCCERWVSAGNGKGIDEEGELATRLLGVGKFDKVTSQSNWLDEFHLEELNEICASFLDLTDNQDWRDPCRSCIYWYLRADVEAVGPDGALILMQAALERLCWQVLDSRKCLSEDGFAKLTAADKLRLTLSVSEIPLAIPARMSGLLAPGKGSGSSFKDGPMALVETRNSLTHSAGKKSAREYHYYEAFTLSKWYFELVMLNVLGYNGLYSNRTIQLRWSGRSKGSLGLRTDSPLKCSLSERAPLRCCFE